MLKWLIATAVVLALGTAITWIAHGPLRRRHETEAGIAALSAMSWRAFIGIVLEALARRGFHRQVDRESAAGDSDYTLIRNGDQWLLSAKHGSAFVLGRAAVKELAAAMALAGAGGGLLLTQGRIADEARLAARGRPIQLLDGAALCFMESLDLYAIFGNLLDNAITAASAVSDPENRLISLKMRRAGDLLYFHIYNTFDSALRFGDCLPQTTKRDAENHGFGMRSVRASLNKYGGALRISADDGVFNVNFMLKKP